MSLEVSLDLPGVSRRSGLSVVGRHLRSVGRYAHLVSGFMGIESMTANAYGYVAITAPGDWGPN